jgi:hypothetical protein
MSTVEAMSPGTLNGTAGNSSPVGMPSLTGGRRRKLKLVTKKAARKALKKLGMKLRGGAANAPVVADAKTELPAAVPVGGRKTKKRSASRRSASRRSSLFGL